jgi:diaminopimelate decarboxylase
MTKEKMVVPIITMMTDKKDSASQCSLKVRVIVRNQEEIRGGKKRRRFGLMMTRIRRREKDIKEYEMSETRSVHFSL